MIFHDFNFGSSFGQWIFLPEFDFRKNFVRLLLWSKFRKNINNSLFIRRFGRLKELIKIVKY